MVRAEAISMDPKSRGPALDGLYGASIGESLSFGEVNVTG